MTTARNIITKALQKLGVLVKSEAPSADEANDGLDALNAMLSSWSNESMLINATVIESFPLMGGVGSYTIGTGQTFNTDRPNFVTDAYVRQNITDYDLTIITDENYDSIVTKNTQGLPEYLNFNNAYPVATIRLYPVPSAANYTLFIRSEKTLSQFTLDSVVDLPPGWQQALIYNLAIMLAPEYGQPVTPELLGIANTSKGAIQINTIRNRSMDALPYKGRIGNFYNGWSN